VIDAGHGGIDGGAEANGVFEKTLNLSVSKKIADFLSFYKVDCVLTRYDDVLLNDEGSTHKKQSDLLNRTIITKSFESPIFVSIHMNKFPVEKYCGLQVFYSQNNPDSKIIADAIQENTVTYIQKDNNRKTKPAGSSIFVLDRLECPAVLIECGFMSNSNELNQLTDDNYQMELAYIISTSIINYLKEL
jgi:N-acetylmuramoyl-L-alanine amidase